jgi:hypothetical protein
MKSPPRRFAFALPLLLAACSHAEPPAPKEPPPPPSSEQVIPVGPVSGKLGGQPFTMKSARYYFDQRPGYEKVDLKLYAVETDTPCTDLVAQKPMAVWLRRQGPERIAAETTTTTVAGGGKWDVHYQVHEDERWAGTGEANALVVMGEPGPDLKIEGSLWACFRDATGSCVSGTFTASYCRIEIDAPVRGTEAMERPAKRALPAPAESTEASP